MKRCQAAIFVLSLSLLSCATHTDTLVEVAYAFRDLADEYANSGMVDDAIRTHRKALELYSRLSDSRYSLALLLLQSGKAKKALEEISILEQQAEITDEEQIKLVAYYYVVTGEYDRAATQYAEIFESGAGDYHSWYNAGILKMKMENTAEAEEYFLKAREADDSSVDAAGRLAEIYFEEGNYAKVVLILGNFDSELGSRPSLGIALLESCVLLEDYSSAFAIMDNLYEAMGVGEKLEEELRDRYLEEMYSITRLLAVVAMDDERALNYVSELVAAEYFGPGRWEELLEDIEDIALVPNTKEFLRSHISASPGI